MSDDPDAFLDFEARYVFDRLRALLRADWGREPTRAELIDVAGNWLTPDLIARLPPDRPSMSPQLREFIGNVIIPNLADLWEQELASGALAADGWRLRWVLWMGAMQQRGLL